MTMSPSACCQMVSAQTPSILSRQSPASDFGRHLSRSAFRFSQGESSFPRAFIFLKMWSNVSSLPSIPCRRNVIRPKSASLRFRCPMASHKASSILNIPSSTQITTQQIEYVAEQISDKESELKLSLTGCFMAAPHCSIPTVRRAVADYLDRLRFVVVYTPNDGLLTTIPVINSDLCTEESYYGEQKLEDLKTWIKQNRIIQS